MVCKIFKWPGLGALDLFGQEASTNAANYYTMGVKGRFLETRIDDDHVLTNPMVKSAAVSDAGLTKQTLYEIGRENLTRSTYDRAMEALDAVNREIEQLMKAAWGRT